MKSPIVFIIFNRPNETRTVFETIKKARPSTLFIIADGPRTDNEKPLCDSARSVVEKIDWPCKVMRNYSDKNLGCKIRVSSGLDWVFDQTDRAIILEDDCVPDQSFFKFCDYLLDYYKDHEYVMHISGNFFHQKNPKFNEITSYFFSKIPHIWGWATWSRAWKKYDVELNKWPALKRNGSLIKKINNSGAYEYWSKIWDQYYDNQIDSWDGQWFFACLINNGICINPTKNLVSNIGFSKSATHSKIANRFSNIERQSISFPIKKPDSININKSYDDYIFRNNFGIDKSLFYRILRPIKNSFPRLYAKIKNIYRRIIIFKNWPKFIWPINKFWRYNQIAALQDGSKILLRDLFSSDFSIALEIGYLNYYIDPSLIKSNSNIIVDVGANIGIFSIMAGRAFPNATIYAIEPEDKNFQQLLKNIKLNNLKNIKPIKAIVSNSVGKKTLYLSKFNSAHSTNFINDSETQIVDSLTLKSFDKIDILKVDTEGSEYEIFSDYIPDCKYIVLEIHKKEGCNERDLINKFRSKYNINRESTLYKLKRLS